MAQAPSHLEDSIERTDKTVNFSSDFQPIERAQEDAARFVSFCDRFMTGKGQTSLCSLAPKVVTLQSQLASGDILPDLGARRREDACSLLSAVHSGLSSCLSHGASSRQDVNNGT